MRFLLRCAFWLALAFIVIAPAADLKDQAQTLSEAALSYGATQVTRQVDSISCETFECLTGKTVAQVALKSVPLLPGEQSKMVTVSMPVPRPADLI